MLFSRAFLLFSFPVLHFSPYLCSFCVFSFPFPSFSRSSTASLLPNCFSLQSPLLTLCQLPFSSLSCSFFSTFLYLPVFSFPSSPFPAPQLLHIVLIAFLCTLLILRFQGALLLFSLLFLFYHCIPSRLIYSSLLYVFFAFIFSCLVPFMARLPPLFTFRSLLFIPYPFSSHLVYSSLFYVLFVLIVYLPIFYSFHSSSKPLKRLSTLFFQVL